MTRRGEARRGEAPLPLPLPLPLHGTAFDVEILYCCQSKQAAFFHTNHSFSSFFSFFPHPPLFQFSVLSGVETESFFSLGIIVWGGQAKSREKVKMNTEIDEEWLGQAATMTGKRRTKAHSATQGEINKDTTHSVVCACYKVVSVLQIDTKKWSLALPSV